ncbi:MAG: hypothetical protein PHG53_09745, partial [Phycisphaerae bacterium]|nr:hypothetical protein [Phycisphaerae bacterium]
ADLRYAKGVNKYLTTPLYLLLDQPAKIRAYKIVKDNYEGIYNGGLIYKKGMALKVTDYNSSEKEQCGSGINLATLDWCIKEYKDGYRIMLCEFTAKDIVAIPIGSDGKFRVKKCKVIKEIDLVKIGLRKIKARRNND